MARSLVFDIFAIDRASHVFRHVGDEAEGMGAKFGLLGKAVGLGVAAVATAAAGVTVLGLESLKTTADMQTRMNRLVSTAGESANGMKTVWAGIDTLAGQVGTSVTKLADAMYYVEGAGFHGADALKVLTAVAKGAKVEMADTTEVAKAIGGALADYNMKAGRAATTTNAFLTAVGHGQTSFEDFANAFPKVGSRAAAANVTLNETLSAMSRMTRDGLPAAMAATYLGQTIGHLAYPTAAAAATMDGLGISTIGVQKAITSGSGHGLGDAIQMLYDGIQRHLTPSGLVAIEMFKKSKGTVSDFQKVLANIPPHMQTMVGALAAMSGGVKGFQGILMLGNDHLKGYKDTLAAVNATTKAGSQTIEGVARQQQSLNGLWDDAKARLTGYEDAIGRKLMPVATQFLEWLNRSMPAFQAWVGTVVKDATPAVQGFSDWFKYELMPALDKSANQIIPALENAWKSITSGVGSSAITWKDFGNFLTHELIPALTLIAKVAIPVLATALRGLLLAVQMTYIQFQIFKAQAIIMSVGTLQAFSKVEAGWGGLLIALSVVPGFGWARAAGTAMINAATAAGALSKALLGIQSPPPINIQVNAYGTSAIANAIISGNAPLANSMMRANAYASGSAYTTTVSGGGSYGKGGIPRASGGPVMPGVTYRVGEEGPENVTFGAPGYVHDAKTTKAGGKGAALHIENYYESKTPAGQVAADLMFRMAHS